MADLASNNVFGLVLLAVIGFAVGWLVRGSRLARASRTRGLVPERDLVVAQERERSLASSARAAELGQGQRVARLEQELGSRAAQVAALTEESARLSRLRQELEARLARNQDELLARGEELAAAFARLADLERQLSEEERRRVGTIHDLEEQVQAMRARISELESAARQKQDLERTLETSEKSLRDQAARIAQLSAESERRLALEGEAAGLRSLVAEREREIESLRLAARPVASPRASASPVAALETRHRHRRPAARDDLKLIHGIGPVLERTLNRLGVTRFRQIARWTDDDIERMARKLQDFPDRIRRDGWIQSARREHIRKFGRDPLTGERATEPT
jgi:predicted flap endonuclease-1-like 5' DNA nuclease